MNTSQHTAHTATIVYESMFGSTRQVAEAIADGLGHAVSVTVVPVAQAATIDTQPDLLVVGAPTHAHSLSRSQSRAEAARWANDPDQGLTLEPDAESTGVREWLQNLAPTPARFAAFDTRVDMPQVFTGSAAKSIDKRLRKRGSQRLAAPESFLVDKRSALEDGELERARSWGAQLAEAMTEHRSPVS